MTSTRTRLGEIKGSIGRILRGDKTDGTCFLIGRCHVLTCDHLLRRDEPVEVWFEGAAARTPELRRWSLGPAVDLAVLEIAAQDLPPIELVQGIVWGESFDTFGYPIDHGGGGVSVSGTIEGPTSILVGGQRGRRLELRAERIVRGFSGAPVLILVDDRIMAVGCISNTGSTSYADVPSCVPVAELRNANTVAQLGISVRSSPALAPTGDREVSAWRLTRQIVDASTPAIDREQTAIEIHAAIEAARQAATADDDRVRALRGILAGLRTKYQRSPVDLAALLQQVEEIRARPRSETALQPTIEMIVADLRLIPNELLSLAAAHGARVHGGVIASYCQPIAVKAAGSADPYGWENVERVVQSLASLIEFDVSQLPVGFGRTGYVRPFQLAGLRALVAVARGYTPHVEVYADHGASALHIARLVGRKTGMRHPYIAWRPSGPVVWATSGGYLYRWRLDAPTPIGDYRLGDDRLGISDVFTAGDPMDPHLLVTTYAGPVADVTPSGEVAWVAHPTKSSSRVWWRDAVSNALVCCEAISASTVLTSRDWTTGNQVARADVSELPSSYPQLFDGLSEDDPDLRRVQQIDDLSRSELLGDTCILASVRLHSFNYAMLFLDERTLAPVRAPVVTEHPIGRALIARAPGKSLLLATAICRAEKPGGVYAWDLSRTASKQAAPFLGVHELAGHDFTSLAVVNHDTGWDAYYVVHALRGDGMYALWRLSWPDMSPVLLGTDLGKETVSAIAVRRLSDS